MNRRKKGLKDKNLIRYSIHILLSIIVLAILTFAFRISEYADTDHLPDTAQSVELYSTETKDDLCQSFVSTINSAQKSVSLIIYSLNDSKIIAALRQKGEEGIPVQVVIDPKTSPYIEKKLGPKVKVIKRFSKGLMHQKILIIDEKLTWLGSANMTGESLRHHGNLVGAIQSESLANKVIAKSRNLQDLERDHYIPHSNFNIGGQDLELWFLPDDKGASKRIVELIRSARKTIKVAMFTWTRQDFAEEIAEAYDRGIKVEVIIDRNSGSSTSEKIVKLFETKGVPVALSQGKALLHHKFMYIDDAVLVNGSANWTKSAFHKNDDCFIVLHGLNEKQKVFMDKLWNVIISNSKCVNVSRN